MERAYQRSLASLYQSDSIMDAATVAAGLVEGDLVEGIKVKMYCGAGIRAVRSN
jgi:hypothetical protein